MQKVFDRGEIETYEIAGPGPHGSDAWYSCRLAPIEQDGQIASAIYVSTDITPVKQSQLELRDREHRFRALIENVALALARCDMAIAAAYAAIVPERDAGERIARWLVLGLAIGQRQVDANPK